MISAQFEVVGYQFKYIGRDWATPAHAFTAAHDMVEHFPDDTGTHENEMQALGAGLWLRRDLVATSIFPKPIHVVIGNDILLTMRDYKINQVKPVPHDYFIPDEMEAHFRDLKAYVLGGHHEVTFMEGIAQLNPEAVQNALAWAGAGIARALERYRGCADIGAKYTALVKKIRSLEQPLGWKKILSIDFDPMTGAIE